MDFNLGVKEISIHAQVYRKKTNTWEDLGCLTRQRRGIWNRIVDFYLFKIWKPLTGKNIN